MNTYPDFAEVVYDLRSQDFFRQKCFENLNLVGGKQILKALVGRRNNPPWSSTYILLDQH